ncbi:MAG TPA: HD-GYP domain-containing protein [Nitrospiria bacterium]|nr:HD-GYP domain-containing protein [Nitrospiria bacterium]
MSVGVDQELLQLGKGLVNQFSILLRTAQIHNVKNVAFEQAFEQFQRTLSSLQSQLGDLSLRVERDALFIGEIKLKMDIDTYANFTHVMEDLKSHQIGTIIFQESVKADELVKFIQMFAMQTAKGEWAFAEFEQQLKRAGVLSVGVEEFQKEEERESLEEMTKDRKEMAKRAYAKAFAAVAEVMDNVKVGQNLHLYRARRVVQSMVDQLLQDEAALVGLTTLRCHDEYTHNHTVNVCILSMVLAQRLGYDRNLLSDLGMAALFHDLGKASISHDLLNKPTDFTEEDWKVVRRHPILGVKTIIKIKGPTESAIRISFGSFEHHLNYDLSGYPRLPRSWDMTLFGRVIGIADCYDALTSARVYNRVPYSPEKALKFMLAKSGRAFDPLLLKVFVNSIGIFPVGTVVLLDSSELGVVVKVSGNIDKADRPTVKIIADGKGNAVDGDIIDLDEQDEKTGHYRHSIVKTIDPLAYGVDVSRYFV